MSSISGLGLRNKARGAKGAINSKLGRGKGSEAASEHVAQPLSSLKDPAQFAPPPKHANYHGDVALANHNANTRGLGAPLSRAQIEALERAEEEEAEEAARSKSPPVPFRIDTTGLSTSHLPPPPLRRDGADGREPPRIDKPKPPGLPPRLPPRQNSNPPPSLPQRYSPASAEPDSHRGILNQGSLNNLSAAGVSVSSLGIGGPKPRQPVPPPRSSPSPIDSPQTNPQLNELQSRFSRLSATSPNPDTPSQGTTFAEKQAALRTASSFRNDPSSVSLGDATTAASTANNFRARHGEQLKSGWQSANTFNNKYGIADKVGAAGGMRDTAPPPANSCVQENASGVSPIAAVAAKKKPPPPPPMKRSALAGSAIAKEPPAAGGPPPINLSNKPKRQLSGDQ